MFLDQSRPLYKSGTHYPLGPIDTKHWIPFIRSRFQKSGRGIGAELIRRICETTGGHPFYTQHLCHAIWELTPPEGHADADVIDQAIDLPLERETYAYTALWESFALNQRRFLAGLAAEAPRVAPFSSDFVQRYRLRSASNAQRAAEALLGRDVIDRDDGSYLISDRFFRIWIRRTGLPGLDLPEQPLRVLEHRLYQAVVRGLRSCPVRMGEALGARDHGRPLERQNALGDEDLVEQPDQWSPRLPAIATGHRAQTAWIRVRPSHADENGNCRPYGGYAIHQGLRRPIYRVSFSVAPCSQVDHAARHDGSSSNLVPIILKCPQKITGALKIGDEVPRDR
ncbi:MAG: hypothetical protein JXB46_10525 [Candidatus Eisenbacteria bacterium]|nr:hypothetical protein [Candidatus Eisenbacteria bacterium]